MSNAAEFIHVCAMGRDFSSVSAILLIEATETSKLDLPVPLAPSTNEHLSCQLRAALLHRSG